MSTKTLPAVVAVVGFAVLVAGYFWFIAAFGANTIWNDQWSDLMLIQNAYSGHLTLSALWAQHNESRILFPNLVVLLLAEVTDFNVKAEDSLVVSHSWERRLCSFSGTDEGHQRLRRSSTSPRRSRRLPRRGTGNTLWEFSLRGNLVLLALSVSLVLCDHPRWDWLVFTGAIVAGVVGSYSSLQGLLIWPAGPVILLVRRRSPLYWLAS